MREFGAPQPAGLCTAEAGPSSSSCISSASEDHCVWEDHGGRCTSQESSTCASTTARCCDTDGGKPGVHAGKFPSQTRGPRASYGHAMGLANIALGKPTRMSSSYDGGGGGGAAKAVDGDTNANWSGGSIAHSGNESDPYLIVEFDATYKIEKAPYRWQARALEVLQGDRKAKKEQADNTCDGFYYYKDSDLYCLYAASSFQYQASASANNCFYYHTVPSPLAIADSLPSRSTARVSPPLSPFALSPPPDQPLSPVPKIPLKRSPPCPRNTPTKASFPPGASLIVPLTVAFDRSFPIIAGAIFALAADPSLYVPLTVAFDGSFSTVAGAISTFAGMLCHDLLLAVPDAGRCSVSRFSTASSGVVPVDMSLMFDQPGGGARRKLRTHAGKLPEASAGKRLVVSSARELHSTGSASGRGHARTLLQNNVGITASVMLIALSPDQLFETQLGVTNLRTQVTSETSPG
eukprot:gene12341-15518_t